MKAYGIPTKQFADGGTRRPKRTHPYGLPRKSWSHTPDVASVVNVCSNCHVFQAQLFEKSPHKTAFATVGFPGCVTCHSNHQFNYPTDEMIGTGNKPVCVEWHTEGDPGYKIAKEMKAKLTELDSALFESTSRLENRRHGFAS